MTSTVTNTRLTNEELLGKERLAEIEGEIAKHLAGLDLPPFIVATHDQATGGIRVSVGRCKDCRHWGTVSYDYFDKDAAGQQGIAHRICGVVGLLDSDDIQVPVGRLKAFTCDASNYKADLWTAPDFGCLLFEPKPAAEVAK